MNVYTIFSHSHLPLLRDHFLPSFNSVNYDHRLKLIQIELPQISVSGDFDSQGFKDTMAEKIKQIIKAIDEQDGKWFLFCDCDIRFYGNFVDDIFSYNDESIDLYCQDDRGGYADMINLCSGFMLMRGNAKNRALFSKALDDYHLYAQEQEALNDLRSMVNYSTLPVTKYFSVCQAIGPKCWEGQDFNVPSDVLMHHANWTIGLENKDKMMKYVARVANNN